MEMQYYLAIDRKRQGPFTKDQVLAARLPPDTLVWFEGCADWVPLRQVPELAGLSGEIADVGNPLYPEAYLRTPYEIGKVFFGCTWFLFSCSIVFFFIDTFGDDPIVAGRERSNAEVCATVAGTLAMLCTLAVGSCFLILLYRCWKVIQDDNVRHSAGTAVGLLFIPVWNIYWIFVATGGLAYELHRYAQRHRLKAPRPLAILGIAISFYTILGAFPFIGIIGWLLNLILVPTFMRSIFETARCFCVENRTVEEDEAILRRPVLARDPLISALFAIVMVPLGCRCACPDRC